MTELLRCRMVTKYIVPSNCSYMCLCMAEIMYVAGRTSSQHVSYKAKCVLSFPICFSLPALVCVFLFPSASVLFLRLRRVL